MSPNATMRGSVRELKTVVGVQLWCGVHGRLPAATGQVLHGVVAFAVVHQVGPVHVQSESAPALADLVATFGDSIADVRDVAGADSAAAELSVVMLSNNRSCASGGR